MKYRVTDRKTGKVHFVSAGDLAKRPIRRSGVFRRDELMRLAKKGQLVLLKSYSFDDAWGESRSSSERKVEMKPDPRGEGWHPKEGIAYFTPWEFKSSSGAARQNEDGTVTLYVHSNLNYTFRIKAARR